ncbi:hypothetical protein EZJ55_00100 [Microcystis aeruginosa EAWAG127a]|uniref:Uncharacterized protein n=1 Tax=Microcystis aeruginosa EAWAG127a TaxID=2529855 RepID=A0A5J5M0R4_MICAE|nr:hypothetical protein [Microcystis aeruginosa]KAB0243987.1 hypothetical protein EZJ55_00100 [Microcystis aeruginosa EAWAG127a]
MGNWFYVILTSALTPIIPDWHFLGDSSNGVWGKFVPRKSEAFDRTVWLEKKLQREIDRIRTAKRTR